MNEKPIKAHFISENMFSILLKKVKLLSLFVFATLVAASASTYTKETKFTFELNNEQVKNVFQYVENNSEFIILYNEKSVDINRKVSVKVFDETVESILNQVFYGTRNSFSIYDRQIVIMVKPDIKLPETNIIQEDIRADIKMEQPNTKEISGKIVDETGNPLVGVSVVVKGTTTGTITDINGNFSIRVPLDAKTLVMSYVGMKSLEIDISDKTSVSLMMEPESIGIEEVVAIGYGVQKKVNLTGAVAAVTIDEKITSRALPNVSSMMQGLMPGLAVNQNSGMAGNNSSDLLIRGLGTVNNARPLIVVDGMPDVDINRLNINDIESISVLKDASSSAVYGSRAANGVILITTKSGKSGETKIQATATFSLEHPTKAFQFMADYPRALTVHQRAAAVNTYPYNFLYKNGTIDQWMALGMIDPLRYPNTDWWDIIIRDGQVKNYNISATGGNNQSNFFISVGVMDEKGLQIGNNFIRYNARINYNAKIRDNINVGAKFAGNWSKFQFDYPEGFTEDMSGGLDLYAAIAGITPYDPVTGYYGGVMAYNENAQAFNPYAEYKIRGPKDRNRQEANGSAFVDWSPLKGLKVRGEYALNYYNQFQFSAPIPTRAFNFQTNDFGSRVYVGENAGISNASYSGYKTLLTGRINYDKTFAGNHTINAMLAYSEEYWYNRSLGASRNDRLYHALHEINAALTDIISNSGSSDAEGLRSYIGRLNYSAFNKYLFEANFRYDGSSKFLPGYQYGFFPSFAVGWRFTDENFFKPIANSINMSSGKIRISHGGLGNNSGVGRYEQKETLAESNYIINGKVVKGFVNKKMVNRDLTWEETNITNLGLDVGFFTNKLTLELDLYNRLTTGMNRPSELSNLLTGAFTAPRRNIGDLRNRGIEANINWWDRKGAFMYSVLLNGSYNKTRLEKWNEFLSRGSVFINMPYSFVYTYEDIGIAQTWEDVYKATPQGASPGDLLLKDLNGDGQIDGNDYKAYPNFQRSRPTTNYGMMVNLAWKGFDMSLFLQGTAGRKDFWLNNYNNIDFPNSHYASTWDHWNKPWSVNNRDGDWPRLYGSSNRLQTSFWLDNLAYLRFKNLQIGYSASSKVIRHLGINGLRIYGSAENLFTITKFRGFDPEKQSYANDVYPLNRIFSIGVNFEI